MKNKKLIIWGSVAVVAVAILVPSLSGNKPVVVFNTSEVRTGTVNVEVMATGYIQPVEVVEVGTQVSGVIEKIYVDYNSQVTAGQLLAELDRSTLEEKLSQANAALRKAQSDLLYAEQNHTRVERLHEAKAATDVSLEEAVNRLAQAQTYLTDASASAKQAKVNRDYAFIYSPINGVILDRKVNVGQTVAASFSTPTLFTIAEDLTKMQVEVNVDEADIGYVRVGQEAVFTVDSYTDEYFEGTVQQIRLQPTVTSNVVTYTVIVEAPNPEEKLFPGMTANITIKVQSDTGLSIPMEALAFRMTPELERQISKHESSFVQQAVAQDAPPAPSAGNIHSVWIRTGDKVEQRNIETGINDGIHTIVKSGLTEGEQVVLSASVGKKSQKQATPLFGGGRRR